MMSFISGLAFAVIEFIFSIYSHSQSALTDAVYDASELVFIALLLFLTPLFHKPVSEKTSLWIFSDRVHICHYQRSHDAVSDNGSFGRDY